MTVTRIQFGPPTRSSLVSIRPDISGPDADATSNSTSSTISPRELSTVFQESNGAGPFLPDPASHVYHSVGHGATFGGETDGHIEVSHHEFCWPNSHQVVVGT